MKAISPPVPTQRQKKDFPFSLMLASSHSPELPLGALTYSSSRVAFSLNPFLQWTAIARGITAASRRGPERRVWVSQSLRAVCFLSPAASFSYTLHVCVPGGHADSEPWHWDGLTQGELEWKQPHRVT